MGKLINHAGERYGRLTVIERGTDYIPPKNYANEDSPVHKEVRWRCKCDCGNIVEVSAKHLRRGMTKSCGCLRSEKSKANITKMLDERWHGKKRAS